MHEKLSTSFVRTDALLEELQAQGFTGYVVMNFPQLSGYLMMRHGQLLTVIELGEREKRVGKELKEHLSRLAQQVKGELSVYYLPEDIMTALAGIAEGEAVYENLTSDFASLDRLIKRLMKERRPCFISLTFNDQPENGGLVYVEGQRVEAICSSENGFLSGAEGLRSLISESEARLATFSLFRPRETGLPAFDESEVEVSINRLASQTAPPSPPPTKQAVQPAYYEPRAPSRGVEPAAPGLTLEESDNILDVAEVEAMPAGGSSPSNGTRNATGTGGRSAPASSAAPAEPFAPVEPTTLPEPPSSSEMSELTNVMSAVVAAVERGMTIAGRGSSFPTALRAGLLAVTEQYPFLDPFAAEFEYHDKEIIFVGSAQPAEFANGLTEALRQMIEDLIYSSNGRVRDYIAEELSKVERERAEELKKFNLARITERICQH